MVNIKVETKTVLINEDEWDEFEVGDGITIMAQDEMYCGDIKRILSDSVVIDDYDREETTTINFADIEEIYRY